MKYSIKSIFGRREYALMIEPADAGGPQPHETGDGYVGLQHMQTFVLRLCNPNEVRTDAEVRVNGKSVGAFRLPMWGEMRLERPENDPARFTAIVTRTREAWAAGLSAGDEQNGLIEVTFRPEKPRSPISRVQPLRSSFEEGFTKSAEEDTSPATYGALSRGSSAHRKEMGIGLSGHSGQSFTTVAALDYDETGIVRISLRICEMADSPTQNVHPIREEPRGNPTPHPVR